MRPPFSARSQQRDHGVQPRCCGPVSQGRGGIWDPMGRRGPVPAPNAITLAKGETRLSRVNYDEPNLPTTSAEPPATLAGVGLLEWQAVAPALTVAGVLRKTDRAATGWIMRLQVDPDPQEQPTVRASDFSPVRFYLCANACVNDRSNARLPKSCDSRQTDRHQ
jgi:hypothetical protein